MKLIQHTHWYPPTWGAAFFSVLLFALTGCVNETGGDGNTSTDEDSAQPSDTGANQSDTAADTASGTYQSDDTLSPDTADTLNDSDNVSDTSQDTGTIIVIDTPSDTPFDTDEDTVSDTSNDTGTETDPARAYLLEETVALRAALSWPDANVWLSQEQLSVQLPEYDPGSLLRCGLNDNADYRAVVEELGGIRWGYAVAMLEDNSKPIFQNGLPEILRNWLDDAMSGDGGGAPVEIAEADIVGLNEEAAVFASNQHGVMLVDLSGDTPRFVCAAKLPGISSKFYYYNGKLVVMAQSTASGEPTHSYLLHFDVSSDALTFIEAIDLGLSRVLDSRRFNNRLVIYTDMLMEEMRTATVDGEETVVPYYSRSDHRILRVFNWGDRLVEELSETQISDMDDLDWIEVTEDTNTAGDLIHQASYFGNAIWASDRYFVITESVRQTYLKGFENRSYSRCTASHTIEVPYTYCYTVYEERPNPNYEPPNNTGGDRACSGTTLSDCLRHVASVSNETIQVPVDRICEQQTRTRFICDAYETVQYTVPQYRYENYTRLAIYEYTENGFIKFASDVAEIQTDGLSQVALTDSVDTLTTSTTRFDLQISGDVQTLYFQNGFLYVIAEGVLQVYAMGDNSLVRTSTLQVVNDTLQTSLFTDNTIYLSDFSWNGRADDTSQLKLIDLSNPGFPTLIAETQELPGGHTHILAINQGIFTIGRVSQFEGLNVSALKLGLFGDPDATELSYLILGTDIDNTAISGEKDFYFNYRSSELFLPYYGYDSDMGIATNRLGISHVDGTDIVSGGALETPERLLRVRPEPGSDRMMGFSNNLIESIVPDSGEWTLQPLLEYYTPIALYRYTDADDYVEVLQLGNRCRLHLAKADQINQRDEARISEPFTCTGAVWAFEQNLIFADRIGMAFDKDGTLTPLTPEETAALVTARAARPYCLLSTTERFPANALRVDFESSEYTMNDFTCMTPEAYWELANTYEDTDASF
ncbi:MAG: hypothetical protein JXX14_18115 [Deltaproteobacteria bacterium]|nr:hypothetical protein [Deltaproteobacteria bacterium]